MNKLVNDNTAVGKSGKVTLWVALSVIIVAVATQILNRPDLFNPVVVGIANVILILVKNLLSSDVDNI